MCVPAVMPTMLVKPPGIFVRMYESTCSVIGPLTFLNTPSYKILSNAALYVLMTVSASFPTCNGQVGFAKFKGMLKIIKE